MYLLYHHTSVHWKCYFSMFYFPFSSIVVQLTWFTATHAGLMTKKNLKVKFIFCRAEISIFLYIYMSSKICTHCHQLPFLERQTENSPTELGQGYPIYFYVQFTLPKTKHKRNVQGSRSALKISVYIIYLRNLSTFNSLILKKTLCCPLVAWKKLAQNTHQGSFIDRSEESKPKPAEDDPRHHNGDTEQTQ